MLAVAVCDDEPVTCADLAGNIRGILDEMGMCHVISQFYSGEELLDEYYPPWEPPVSCLRATGNTRCSGTAPAT